MTNTRRWRTALGGALGWILLGSSVAGCSVTSVLGQAGGATGGGGSGALSSTGGTYGTGGAGGTGGEGAGPILPAYGLVPFDASNDITTQACAGKEFEPETRPVLLQMVVDVSTSMRDQPPNSTSGQTKWEITRDALIAAIDHLPAAAELGVTFYPNKKTDPNFTSTPNSDCINPGQNFPITYLGNKVSQARIDVKARLNGITIVDNEGTPTHDAYDLALAGVLAMADTDPKYASTPKYMLLITDGQPTFARQCIGYGLKEYPQPPGPIITAIEEALATNKIKTFMIGSPGSEQVFVVDGGNDARPWLSEAATAGGTADFQPGCTHTGTPTYCHFDMTTASDFGQALGTALQQITNSIAPCDYAVIPPEGTVVDPELVNVVYTEDAQKYGIIANQTAASADCALGWRYTDTTGSQIEICGGTCEYIANNPFAVVNILLGCKSILPVY